MIISHKYKFIFFDIERTGATSIQSVLTKYDEDGIQFHKHAEYQDVSYFIDIFNIRSDSKYTCFTSIRNPWDHAVSRFEHNKKLNEQEKTFDDFESWITSNKGGQLKSITGKDGNVITKHIIRFENIQGDFDAICERIGIPSEEIPHLNSVSRKHYTEYYSDKTRKIIASQYAQEIEMFSYKFGD